MANAVVCQNICCSLQGSRNIRIRIKKCTVLVSPSSWSKFSIFCNMFIPLLYFSHNNHTGRWLTGFRAQWHPMREDVFVVGSMNRPREVRYPDFEGFSIPDFIHYIYFYIPILILEEEPVFSLLNVQC